MKIQLKTFKALFLIIGFLLIITPQSSLAQNANTILILPFDVQADPKYNYLKPAVMDMLFTRLSAPGRTLVLGKREEQPRMSPIETTKLADAVQIGQEKGADYIVTGRISLRENAVSTNAEFIGTTEQRALITFIQNGAQPGDIITQIDKFTAQVNAEIFNPRPFIAAQTPQADDADEIYQHPEKLTIPETSTETPARNESTQVKKRPNLQPVDDR